MAIETSHSVSAKVEESDVILARFDTTPVVRASTYTEYSYQRLVLPDGTSDQAVGFGGCAVADLLFLETDQAITIKVSGGSARDVASIAVLSEGATSLTISNDSGETATVDVLVLD